MSFLPAAITVSEVVASKPSINSLIRRHKIKLPLRVYEFFTVQRPVLAKAATGGILAGVGNYVAQKYEISTHAEKQKSKHPSIREPTKKLDFHRIASFAAFNALWMGGPTHLFFGALARSSMTTGKKLFATHFIFNPFVYFPAYYGIYGGFMGQSLQQIKNTAAVEFYPTYRSCVMMWVPINALQFLIIPPNFHVLYMASMNLAWSIFLSAQGGGSEKSTSEDSDTSISNDNSLFSSFSTPSASSSTAIVVDSVNESMDNGNNIENASTNNEAAIIYSNFAEFPELEDIESPSKNANSQIISTLKGAWATGPRYYSTAASCEENKKDSEKEESSNVAIKCEERKVTSSEKK